MTLEQVDSSLPNGLHDAKIIAVTRDFRMGLLRMEVYVLVALPGDPEEDKAYRRGILEFHGPLFFTVAMPENERILGLVGSVWFVWSRMERHDFPDKIAVALPAHALCYSLYVLEWESCIQVAAEDVSFVWAESH